MLFGIGLLYCYFGSLHLLDMQILLSVLDMPRQYVYVELGFSFFTFGLLFKLYCVPLHFWVPDIYHGAPISTTVLLASISYLSTFCVFMNVFFIINIIDLLVIQHGLYYFIILCLLIGGFGGIYQIQIKRLIAYSSISTVGYLLYGFFDATEVSVLDTIFFMVTYCVTVIGVFFILVFVDRKSSLEQVFECTTLEHFSGFFFINKYLCLFFGILFFSLSGIPPYTGFFPKYFIFDDCITFGESGVFLAMLVNSFCGCFFYINFIKTLYYESPLCVLSCTTKYSYFIICVAFIIQVMLFGGLLVAYAPTEFVMLADLNVEFTWLWSLNSVYVVLCMCIIISFSLYFSCFWKIASSREYKNVHFLNGSCDALVYELRSRFSKSGVSLFCRNIWNS